MFSFCCNLGSDGKAPSAHSAFDTVFNHFFTYLQTVKPNGVMVEEVPPFQTRRDELGNTFLDSFLWELEQLGYACGVFRLSPRIWMEMERVRPAPKPCFLDRRTEPRQAQLTCDPQLMLHFSPCDAVLNASRCLR